MKWAILVIVAWVALALLVGLSFVGKTRTAAESEPFIGPTPPVSQLLKIVTQSETYVAESPVVLRLCGGDGGGGGGGGGSSIQAGQDGLCGGPGECRWVSIGAENTQLDIVIGAGGLGGYGGEASNPELDARHGQSGGNGGDTSVAFGNTVWIASGGRPGLGGAKGYNMPGITTTQTQSPVFDATPQGNGGAVLTDGTNGQRGKPGRVWIYRA